MIVSQEEGLTIVEDFYKKALEVEKTCRESVVRYLEYAIEVLIDKGNVTLDLKRDYMNLKEKFSEIEEKHGEEISEEYITDLDAGVREYYKCYDQFKTLNDVNNKESIRWRRRLIIGIILTAIISSIATILTAFFLSLLTP